MSVFLSHQGAPLHIQWAPKKCQQALINVNNVGQKEKTRGTELTDGLTVANLPLYSGSGPTVIQGTSFNFLHYMQPHSK